MFPVRPGLKRRLCGYATGWIFRKQNDYKVQRVLAVPRAGIQSSFVQTGLRGEFFTTTGRITADAFTTHIVPRGAIRINVESTGVSR